MSYTQFNRTNFIVAQFGRENETAVFSQYKPTMLIHGNLLGNIPSNLVQSQETNMFDEAFRDVISIVKADSSQFDGIKASVQGEKVIFFVGETFIYVEEGDQIIRYLPQENREIYTVIDPGYRQGLDGDIPASYQMKVKRVSRFDAERFFSDPTALTIKVNILKALSELWNLEEFKTLCFSLGVNYDSLGGEGVEGKARELIQHSHRQGKLGQLLEQIKTQRPEANL